MANSRQAIKRIKVAEKKRIANRTRKSSLRTLLKKSKLAIENNDPQAADLLKRASKELDKAAAKNVIHKNTASRNKSKLAKAYNVSVE